MPKWKPGIFGTGPCVPMDREARAVFKAKLQLQRRPGRLTIATAAIGRVLVDMLGPDGRLDPSLATIAERARVSVATVKRALAQLRECGFVTWTRRLIRDAASGWRTEQASSAYVLSVPATEVYSEAHFDPPVVKKFIISVQLLATIPREASKAAREGLASIAASRSRSLGLAR
jgi:hypothetical protein